jgi:hypothetical protein
MGSERWRWAELQQDRNITPNTNDLFFSFNICNIFEDVSRALNTFDAFSSASSSYRGKWFAQYLITVPAPSVFSYMAYMVFRLEITVMAYKGHRGGAWAYFRKVRIRGVFAPKEGYT